MTQNEKLKNIESAKTFLESSCLLIKINSKVCKVISMFLEGLIGTSKNAVPVSIICIIELEVSSAMLK